jgi:hypothetical protein
MRTYSVRDTVAVGDHLDPYGALLDEQFQSFKAGNPWSDEEWSLRMSLRRRTGNSEIPDARRAVSAAVPDQDRVATNTERRPWYAAVLASVTAALVAVWLGVHFWPAMKHAEWITPFLSHSP